MIVDTHLHLWHLGRSSYSWLTPQHGDLYRTFAPREAQERLSRAGIERAVLVQADDTIADSRLMLEIADDHAFVLAVVGWVPLDEPEAAAAHLDEFAGARLRGIRHLVHDDPRSDFLVLEPVQRSLAMLAVRGLAFEVPDAWPRHLGRVEQVARTHADLTVVIDHLAKPPRGTDAMADWEAALRRVARLPNTYAKLSGLQVPGQPFTVDALRPVFHLALEMFGPGRLMYGGDWPMTLPHGDYHAHWTVIQELVAELPEHERAQLLGGTAHQIYGDDAHA